MNSDQEGFIEIERNMKGGGGTQVWFLTVDMSLEHGFTSSQFKRIKLT